MSLRIIAGKYRRRTLKAPRDQRIRPTQERVREAAFNLLAHGMGNARAQPLPEDVPVLDVFSGTGAMGFEALSRGAAFVTFLETDAEALALLRQNAASLDKNAPIAILRCDGTRPGRPREAAAVVFLDPPYGQGLAAPALGALGQGGWLREEAVAVVEMGAKESLVPPSGFLLLDERRYGTTKLVFLLYEAVPQGAA